MRARILTLAAILFLAFFAAGVQAGEEDTPSIEVLEFLGEWETSSGEWLDPTEFQDAIPPEEEQQDEGQESR